MKTTLTLSRLLLLALCLQLSACTDPNGPAGDNPQLLAGYVTAQAADTQEKSVAHTEGIGHRPQDENSTLVGRTDVSPTQRVRLTSSAGPVRLIPLYH